MTLAEIAEELRVNPATVRVWVSKGQLKASRAGVRKWIVRRSDLDRMLAATNPRSAEENAERSSALPPSASGFPDHEEAADAYAPDPRLQPPAGTSDSAAELLQIANRSLNDAFRISAHAPPGPGYVDRLRGIADACEHVAATLQHASRVAGVRWTGRDDFGTDKLPYELRPTGNRPWREDLWERFDSAVETLAITMTGHDTVAVADGFRDMGDALLAVADALERDDSWRVGYEAG
jgi:excisionase family DNA binding protein